MNLDDIEIKEVTWEVGEMPTKEEVEQFEAEMELYDAQLKAWGKILNKLAHEGQNQ